MGNSFDVRRLLVCVLTVQVLAGCGAETGRQASVSREASRGADSGHLAGTEAVTLHTVDLEGYRQALKKHAGRVVLVDFWATWCHPCIERFSETVAWSKKYERDGLAVISVSFDNDEDQAAALEFLRTQDAKFTNLRSRWGNGGQTVDSFEIQGGAVPYYKLYDRSGKLRYEFSPNPETLDSVESLDRIEPRLQELLGEQTR